MVDSADVKQLLSRFEDLPRFQDGRIDYTHADSAAVVNCFVMHDGRLLLLKRSDQVMVYPGKWNVVGGFLDEAVSVKQKVCEELSEELGIEKASIDRVEEHEMFEYGDRTASRTWFIFPTVVTLNSPDITLDWEHTEYRWIQPGEISKFDIVPGLDRLAARVLVSQTSHS